MAIGTGLLKHTKRDNRLVGEARRFRCNLYVGMVGAVTWFLVLIAGSAAVKPGDYREFRPYLNQYLWGTLIADLVDELTDFVSALRAARLR